jgi:hypothetical protein
VRPGPVYRGQPEYVDLPTVRCPECFEALIVGTIWQCPSTDAMPLPGYAWIHIACEKFRVPSSWMP